MNSLMQYLARRARASMVAVIAILALIPATAFASGGWQIRRFVYGHGVSGHSSATRCASSKFGKYTIRGTVHTGSQAVHEVATVQIVNDGHVHYIHQVSLSISGSTSPVEKQLIKQIVGGIIGQIGVKVISLSGNQLTTQAYYKGHPSGGQVHNTLHHINSC